VSDPHPDRPTTQLSQRTLAGLQWTYLATAVGAVLQFGMTAVLARLLPPAAFGLVALAGLFLRFMDYFAKAGITQALVQKPDLSKIDIRAGFTLSAGLGTIFAALAIVASPLAASIGREPQLAPILQLLSLGLVANGLGAPSVALLRRRLQFKPLAIIDVASYTLGYVFVGLILAVAGAGVYALVAATLTQTLSKSLGAYAVVRHSIVPTFNGTSHRSILRFGARVSMVSFLEFLQSNLDTLAVGRWAGATQLGLYNRANLLADLPAYHLSTGLSRVLLPSFSAIQTDHRRLRDAYISAVSVTSAIILPLNAGMAVAANEIVLVVLGPNWIGSTHVLPWLLLASSIALTGHFAGIAAEAQAALNAKLIVAGLATAVLALLLLLARGQPLPAYGAALAATAAVSHFGYVTILKYTLRTTFAFLFRPYLTAIIAASLTASAIAAVRVLLLVYFNSPLVLTLSVQFLIGAALLWACFRVGPLRGQAQELIRRLQAAGVYDRAKPLVRSVLQIMLGSP
jgi:lipopolysaccharide exporter